MAVPEKQVRRHLAATMRWIGRAQDVTASGGISAGYTTGKGWSPAFPETTGYLIPTLIAYADSSGEGEYRERARRALGWLLPLQLPDGAFPAGVIGDRPQPSVFNTGQIIFGLLRGWQEWRDAAPYDAAMRAGRWLAGAQEPDGSWQRHDFLGHAHVYNTRTAWALALLAAESGEAAFAEAARRNLDWAGGLADSSGYFRGAEFEPVGSAGERARSWMRSVRDKNRPSFYSSASLHTIAYTLQGVFETSRQLGEPRNEVVASRALAAAALLARDLQNGRLGGFYAPGWKRVTRSTCLTGVAQMGIVWRRLAAFDSPEFAPAADRALERLLEHQARDTRREDLEGAVAGSSPPWGLYLPFRYPNWAAKFTADLYLLSLLDETGTRALRTW